MMNNNHLILSSLIQPLIDYITIMNQKEKEKIQYVVGIDLGHGETSAALCAMEWEKKPEQLDGAKDLEMGGNKKVIPSAIAILDNGDAYIGSAAFHPNILNQAEVHVCFKQAPKDINGEKEQLMIRYMQEVYRRILENNTGTLTDGNHLVYIATPSGWDAQTQKLYVEMAKQAGLPITDTGVTKESRAAFVRAQHDATSGIGRNVEKGAIVFDMGSSTLDFTYMSRNIKGLIDNGYNCGASAVEKAIYAKQREKEDCIRRFEKKYARLVDCLVFKAREIKEEVYYDTTLPVKKRINLDDIIDDEEFEDDDFKFKFAPGDLDNLLEENGYIQEIRNAMLDYKQNYINGHNIYGVFMTGGASRMTFLKNLICECWGVTEEQIHRDQDPSLTISQGVAELARMDLRTEGMDNGIAQKIDNLINGNKIYNDFIQRFGDDLKQNVRSGVASVVIEFKDASENYCLNDLENGIKSAVQDSITEGANSITNYMESAVMDNTAEIRETVDNIVANYVAQGENVAPVMKSFNIAEIKIDGINLNSTMSSISAQIAAESSDWSSAMTGAAIGGAIAMIFGGPLMWLVGGAALIGKAFFGDSEADKRRKAKAKALDRENRIKVYETIEAKWEEITANIDSSIDKALAKNGHVKDSINNVVKQLLMQYKDSLRNSRILID